MAENLGVAGSGKNIAPVVLTDTQDSLSHLRLQYGLGHPNLNLTPEEKRVYKNLFNQADPDGVAVSGDVAVKFFEKTRLPGEVLGQVGK